MWMVPGLHYGAVTLCHWHGSTRVQTFVSWHGLLGVDPFFGVICRGFRFFKCFCRFCTFCFNFYVDG